MKRYERRLCLESLENRALLDSAGLVDFDVPVGPPAETPPATAPPVGLPNGRPEGAGPPADPPGVHGSHGGDGHGHDVHDGEDHTGGSHDDGEPDDAGKPDDVPKGPPEGHGNSGGEGNGHDVHDGEEHTGGSHDDGEPDDAGKPDDVPKGPKDHGSEDICIARSAYNHGQQSLRIDVFNTAEGDDVLVFFGDAQVDSNIITSLYNARRERLTLIISGVESKPDSVSVMTGVDEDTEADTIDVIAGRPSHAGRPVDPVPVLAGGEGDDDAHGRREDPRQRAREALNKSKARRALQSINRRAMERSRAIRDLFAGL